MKILSAIALIIILASCSSATRVSNSSNIEVCEKHANYSLWQNQAGTQLTLNEISKREIERSWCLDTANAYIQKKAPKLKLDICQKLALYNFKGAFTHYSKTLETIKRIGFYDKECEKMAQLYNVRLRRDRLENEALAEEFKEAPIKSEVVVLENLEAAL